MCLRNSIKKTPADVVPFSRYCLDVAGDARRKFFKQLFHSRRSLRTAPMHCRVRRPLTCIGCKHLFQTSTAAPSVRRVHSHQVFQVLRSIIRLATPGSTSTTTVCIRQLRFMLCSAAKCPCSFEEINFSETSFGGKRKIPNPSHQADFQ